MEMLHNPVLPGFNPDPCLCRRGDDYYLVVSSFEWFPALPVYHSRDLCEWTLLTHCIQDESVADLRRLPSAKGIWAPCLTWCEAESRFYLLFSLMNSMNARFFDVDNFLMTAPDITGPWSEPTYLHSAGFDPSILHDSDGRKWIVSLEWETREGYHKPGVICAVEYDALANRVVGTPQRIWEGATRRGCIEGPHLYRRGDYYYLMCAEGGTGYGHCVTVARSEHVLGPYTGDPQNPILTSTPDFDEWDNDDAEKLNRYNPKNVLQKCGHGSIVETGCGETYMAHHCGRPFLPELRCTLGRETCLQKMFWTRDGWLRLEGGGNIAQEYAPASSLCENSGNSHAAAISDNNLLFGLYTPRISPLSFVDLTAREGWIRMRGQESLSSLNRSSILAHKLTSLHAEASVKMEMSPLYYQAYAGIIIYYDNMDYLLLRKSYNEKQGGAVLDILSVDNGNRVYVAGSETPVDARALCLKVTVDGRSTRFYWCYEGEVYEPIGPVFDTSRFSDEYCKSGEFTGTFLGIGCVDALFHGAYADFTDFDYRVL